MINDGPVHKILVFNASVQSLQSIWFATCMRVQYVEEGSGSSKLDLYPHNMHFKMATIRICNKYQNSMMWSKYIIT